jgi:hypothetical protein
MHCKLVGLEQSSTVKKGCPGYSSTFGHFRTLLPDSPFGDRRTSTFKARHPGTENPSTHCWYTMATGIFYVLALSLWSYSALSLNTTVQVNLVFPRNNTVYQPVYPFPIVFAVSNFASAAPYVPAVRWTLLEVEPVMRNQAFANSGAIGWDTNQTRPNFGPQPDKYLSIDSTIAISQSNQSYWILEYTFFVGSSECFGPETDIRPRGSVGRIFFNTSRTTGVMPDLSASGPCPFTLGAVGIRGQNQTDPMCPLLASPPPAPSCTFPVDAEAVAQISKAMVDTSRCKNVTWPGGTGIGNHCDPNKTTKKSEGSTLRANLFALVPLLATLVTT